MTKQDAMTTILSQLHDCHFNPDEFDGKALDTAVTMTTTATRWTWRRLSLTSAATTP